MLMSDTKKQVRRASDVKRGGRAEKRAERRAEREAGGRDPRSQTCLHVASFY